MVESYWCQGVVFVVVSGGDVQFFYCDWYVLFGGGVGYVIDCDGGFVVVDYGVVEDEVDVGILYV